MTVGAPGPPLLCSPGAQSLGLCPYPSPIVVPGDPLPPLQAPAHAQPRPSPWPPDPLLGAAQDEKGLDTVLLEVGVALPTAARLHFVVPIQVLQRGPGDVDAAAWDRRVRPQLARWLPPLTPWTRTHPARPPASMWLARVTSWDQTSYCHFCSPMTPQSTLPECTPTRMLISTPVAARSFLSEMCREQSEC